MLMTERTSQSCRELQYLLWEEEIARFLSELLPLGSEARIRRDRWRICSVYLDRPDGTLSSRALAGPEQRVELRVRDYAPPEGGTLSPGVWIEAKERAGTFSRVTRFQLDRRLLSRFRRGDLEEAEVLDCQPRHVEADRVLQAFRAVRGIAGLRPLVVAGAVSLIRLALEGGAPEARLTLDQEITYHSGARALDGPSPSLDRATLGPVLLEEPAAVVEVKSRGFRLPDWCERRTGPGAPVEYSKFLILSALALSDRLAKRAGGEPTTLQSLSACGRR